MEEEILCVRFELNSNFTGTSEAPGVGTPNDDDADDDSDDYDGRDH